MFGTILSILWSLVRGFFGKSDAEKLGIAETQVQADNKVMNEVQYAKRMEQKNSKLSDAAIDNRLRSKYQRD